MAGQAMSDGGMSRIMSVPANKPVIYKLITYTLIMVTIPVSIFLFSFYLALDPAFRFLVQRPGEDGEKLIWSAVFAVISVNAIMAAYVVSAIREDGGLNFGDSGSSSRLNHKTE